MRAFTDLYRRSQSTLLWCITLSFLQSLFLLPIPLIVRYLFDTAIPQQSIRQLLWGGTFMLLLYLFDALLSLKIRTKIQRVIKDTIQSLRENLLWTLYRLSQDFHIHSDRSKLHTMITQDTERIDAMSNAILTQLAPALLSACGFTIVLFFLSPFLFLITILLLPLLFFASRALNDRARKEVYSFHRSFETFSKGVLFVLQNISLTRIQSAEELEMDRQKRYLSELNQKSSAMIWLRTLHFSVQSLVAGISLIVILVAGGIAVMKGRLSIGQLLSFSVAVALWRNALSSASQCIPQVLEGNESLKTLQGFLLTDAPLPYRGEEQIEFSGNLNLQEVSFSYSDSPLLQNIDLEFSKGEIVAIIGPNGSGKTTISNLILGFYAPQKGKLHADGVSYAEIDLSSLRRFFGVVPQEPIPFHGTIFENLIYGNPDVPREQVRSVAKLSGASDFIEKLPAGYDTTIGEQGMILSGGQRQLLALTRAILRSPRFLILDEPTKHLDQDAVVHFLAMMQQMTPTPTVLLISHEPEVISRADRVFMIQDGILVPAHGIL